MVTSKKHSSAEDKAEKDKVCNGGEYGEGLVGSRIRVWWPIDRKFYKGVVDSFNSSKKKHRVVYDDGDKETLNMRMERWELIEEEEEEDDDDAEAEEISLQDESADESSEGTPEPLITKKVKSNGNSYGKGRVDEAVLKENQSIASSAKRKLKANSGKKSEDGESETFKDGAKQTPKNGKLGDVGGKIVAAASRMSGRLLRKENGQEKESLETVKISKKTSESNYQKQKRPHSSSEAVTEKVKRPRTSSEKDEDNEDDEDENTSDEDCKPLLSLLKHNPEAMEALMKKLNRKKEKEAGGESSGNEKEEDSFAVSLRVQGTVEDS